MARMTIGSCERRRQRYNRRGGQLNPDSPVLDDSALIVVDVQNDFCAGGPLAVQDAEEILPIINRLIQRHSHVAFTRDWHPADHCSFAVAPRFADGGWPVHCVADTAGAAFHPGLDVPPGAPIVSKGSLREVEAYSGFVNPELERTLREWGVKSVYVCGIATDYCVKSTALDAKAAGFDVSVVRDACRAVDGSGAAAFSEMAAAGISVVDSETLPI
jgi:nicotinamidase/pyrazinamidase